MNELTEVNVTHLLSNSAVLLASCHLRKNLYRKKGKIKGLFYMCNQQTEATTTLEAWAHFHDWLKCRDLTLTQNIYWLDGLSLSNGIKGFNFK